MKKFVNSEELSRLSFHLGALVYNSGFRPDYLIALWRGGVTIGIHVHELLKYKGVNVDHIAIRTSSYEGQDNSKGVNVHNLNYVTKNLKVGSKILLIDDVYESGNSIGAVIQKITKESGLPLGELDIRVATVFYKSKRNRSYRKPDYYVEDTDEWLVFPHEVEALSLDEIEASKGLQVRLIFESLN